MSLRLKITVGILTTVFGVVAYFVYRAIYTARHIPEAYAAWDTGTLVVEYMDSHGGEWPTSWDDLLSMISTNPVLFRGASHGDSNYAYSLRTKVAIDWSFDPKRKDESRPVTRPDGSGFPIVWQGKEPNQMILTYIRDKNATNVSGNR